jgi:inner membrane protein
LIGASVCALWQPAAVPAAVLGATAPDWLEWVGRNHLPLAHAAHRGATHNLLGWVLVTALGWTVDAPWGTHVAAFGIGGSLHWLCDSLTVTGAPLTWWSQHRSTLFGGRLRQGSQTERALAIGVAVVCGLLAWPAWDEPGEFSPYLMPWRQHYRAGLIDAAEWRRHRYSPF